MPPRAAAFVQPDLDRALWRAKRAEANLIRQGDFGHLSIGNTASALSAPVGQSFVVLGDALDRRRLAQNWLSGVQQAAQHMHLAPFVYKSSARIAVAARGLGWQVLPVAREAWLRPDAFSPEGPARRQLRRSLRKATAAGIVVHEGGTRLPLRDMEKVAAAWARDHGGERGFSMGRFNVRFVQSQRVFLATKAGELVAFITLHEAEGEWTLDLMRNLSGVADGTMHALVHSAIQAAAAVRCPRLSLAASPHPGKNDAPSVAWLRSGTNKRAKAAGLTRFKASFAPNWEPLYAIAPNRAALVVGLWDVARQVHRTAK